MRLLPLRAASRRPRRHLPATPARRAPLARRAAPVVACLALLTAGIPLPAEATPAAPIASIAPVAPAPAAAPALPAAPPGRALLRSGRLATASCQEPPIVDRGIPRTREYLTAALECLRGSWSAHFARAGLRFREPTVRFYEEPARRVCGLPWPPNASAFYCTERATLVFPLAGAWIEDRTDLYPLKVAAHEYGHHLQSLTGVRAAYEARARSDRARRAELGRRYELQADCLSGVFLGSVRHSLPRTEGDWEALYDTLRASGDEGERHTHGIGANRVRWFKRGHGAVSPAACDTWSAAPSLVS